MMTLDRDTGSYRPSPGMSTPRSLNPVSANGSIRNAPIRTAAITATKSNRRHVRRISGAVAFILSNPNGLAARYRPLDRSRPLWPPNGLAIAIVKTAIAIHLFLQYHEKMRKGEYLGNFELMLLLALLRLGQDAYGVTIAEELEERTGREVVVASVYATLERLQERGLVTSSLGDPTPERGGRAKRYFRITTSGIREVRDARRSLMNLWKGLPALRGEKA